MNRTQFKLRSSRTRKARSNVNRFNDSLTRKLFPKSKVKLRTGPKQSIKTYSVKGLTKDGYFLLEGYFRLNSGKTMYYVKVHSSNLVKL